MVKTPYILKTLEKLLARVDNIYNQISMLRGQASSGSAPVGVNGSNRVYKNSNFYLKDQYGLYHLEVGVLIEGQMQIGYENIGYTYATIP